MTLTSRLQRDDGFAEVLAGKQIGEGLANVLDPLEAMLRGLNDTVSQPLGELVPGFVIAIVPEVGHETLHLELFGDQFKQVIRSVRCHAVARDRAA